MLILSSAVEIYNIAVLIHCILPIMDNLSISFLYPKVVSMITNRSRY